MKARPVVVAVLSAALIAAATAIAYVFYSTRPKPRLRRPNRPVPEVLAPKIQPVRNYRVPLIANGSARPKVRLEIIPQVSGEVVAKSENFLSGRIVKKGQVLFQIDRTDYRLAREAALGKVHLLEKQLKRLDQERANLAAAEAIERRRVKLAEKSLANFREMLAAGAGAKTDVDTAEEALLARKQQLQNILSEEALIEPKRAELLAQKRIAEVELDQAKTNYDRTTFRSPVTGRVLGCKLEVGTRVQAGSACGELYGTDVMEVVVAIPAGDLEWIDPNLLNGGAPGDAIIPAKVEWARPGGSRRMEWSGRVDRIEAGLDAQTRTARLVVQVRNDSLEPGTTPLDINMFCRVTVLGRRLERVFLVPRGAILPGESVYVVEDGRLAVRKVTVARFTDSEAMILPGGGIEPGRRVVTGPVAKPVLGMRVRPDDGASAASTTTAPPDPGSRRQ